jgi:dTDP-4-amino-4,6-dideoxygalactose transaminase
VFIVQHPERDRLQQALTDAGVGTLIHYPVPPHLSGAYAELNLPKGRFPIAEHLARTILSLPMGPHLTTEQADQVIEAVHMCCSALRGTPDTVNP